jgi:hypothetical protein
LSVFPRVRAAPPRAINERDVAWPDVATARRHQHARRRPHQA